MEGGIHIQNDFFWGALQENFEQKLRDIKENEKRHQNPGTRSRKKKKLAKAPYVRKNRPFVRTSTECCLGRCLHKNGGQAVMRMTRLNFSSKCYDEQNLMLRNLMKIIHPTVTCVNSEKSRRTRFLYYLIDDNARKIQVCRTAFLKTFAISVTRIRTVVSKVMPYTPALQPDNRGKHHNHLKVTQYMRNRICEFVTKNYKSEESHYCRQRTNKKFLTPTVSKTGMWKNFESEFQNQDNNSKYTRRRKNTKHVISRKKFLDIVLHEFDFTFRKLRKDTCDICDKFKASLSRSRNNADRNVIEQEHEEHLRRANSKYLKHDYDFLVLAKAHSTTNWVIPPEWPRSK